MTLPDEVDIIVLGGGSCGCAVAGRLANLDHNLQVMLVEAGESNLNNPWWALLYFYIVVSTCDANSTNRVYRPGIYPKNMKLDSKTATFYESRASEWLGGRKAIVPCAHVRLYIS